MMQRFTLTENHIALLRHGNVSLNKEFLNGFGTIGLDGKRPFGNSDITNDMAEILKVEPLETDDGPAWPLGTTDRMLQVFNEQLPVALQIVLRTGKFEPGEYECGDYDSNWSKCDGQKT